MAARKNTRRITITIDNDLTDEIAIDALLSVIRQGKISEANNKKQYCWYTSFQISERPRIKKSRLVVISRPKYDTNNDRFVIYKSES